VDFEAEYRKLRIKPTIINDYNTTSIDDKNFIKDLIYTKYEGDVLTSIPRCNCPTSANPIVGADREGEYCPKCRSTVSSHFGENLESILWVRSPKDVEAFINPRIWQGLKQAFGNRRVDLLNWLTNTAYNVKSQSKPEIIMKLEAMGITRGYNNFVRNFWKYIGLITEMKEYKRKPAIKALLIFLETNKYKIFTRWLPLPNRALFIIEPTNVEKTYMDLIGIGAIDAIALLTSIDVPGNKLQRHAKENRTSKFLANSCIFQENYLRKNIAKKAGSYRKHIVSSRVAPSFRNVITSITEPHDYEQIVVPWSTAMTILQPHLENIFLKKGFTANEILAIFNKYINRYDERLYNLMKKILYDYGEKGMPTLWNRNPTLGRSSILMLFIGDIKKDVTDPTVSMSIGLCVFFNADFDGDAMNGYPLYDKYMARAFESFRAHNCVLDINTPNTMSSYMGMSKTCVGNGMNWMHEPDHGVSEPEAAMFLA
jgi:hypothetical protein